MKPTCTKCGSLNPISCGCYNIADSWTTQGTLPSSNKINTTKKTKVVNNYKKKLKIAMEVLEWMTSDDSPRLTYYGELYEVVAKKALKKIGEIE